MKPPQNWSPTLYNPSRQQAAPQRMAGPVTVKSTATARRPSAAPEQHQDSGVQAHHKDLQRSVLGNKSRAALGLAPQRTETAACKLGLPNLYRGF